MSKFITGDIVEDRITGARGRFLKYREDGACLVELETLREEDDIKLFNNYALAVEDDDYIPTKEENERPSRYSSREVNGMDVIDLVKHWNLNFNEGNILKYLLRDKGEDASDLYKIIDYAKRELDYLGLKKD